MELSKHYLKDWIIRCSVMFISSLGLFLYSAQYFNKGKRILIQASKSIGQYDTRVISPFEMSMYDWSPIFGILVFISLAFALYKIIDASQLDDGIELLNSLSDNYKSKENPEKINEFQKVSEVSYFFNKNQGKEKEALG